MKQLLVPTGCSKIWPNGAGQRWDGSSISSFTSSSITNAKSWRSRSVAAMSMIESPWKTWCVAYAANSSPTRVISAKSFLTKLWRNGLQLITGIRKTMKNYLMPWFDKVLLRKRFIIETLFDKLKSDMSLEHSRHRSPVNALVHILSCLVAYCFSSNKPKIGTVISMVA